MCVIGVLIYLGVINTSIHTTGNNEVLEEVREVDRWESSLF